MKILKCLLMIVTAPVVLVLTLFVWLCTGLIYISGLVLGLLSTVIALLGVAVLITYPNQTCKISSSINRGNTNSSYVFPLFIEQLLFICFCVMNFSFFLFVLYILLHICENIVHVILYFS